jgi:hypothetical protein
MRQMTENPQMMQSMFSGNHMQQVMQTMMQNPEMLTQVIFCFRFSFVTRLFSISDDGLEPDVRR